MVSMDLFRIGMEEAFGLRVNPPSFEITDCDFKTPVFGQLNEGAIDELDPKSGTVK